MASTSRKKHKPGKAAPVSNKVRSRRQATVVPPAKTRPASVEDQVLALARTLTSEWKDAAQRSEALVALNKLDWQATRALPAIVAALDDPDDRVRLKAFQLVNKLCRGILEDAALICSSQRQKPQKRLAAILRIVTVSPEIRQAIGNSLSDIEEASMKRVK
jgi:hypothetical protein